MKKILLINIIVTIIVITLAACSFDKDSSINTEVTTGVIIKKMEVNVKGVHQPYSGIANDNV